MGSLTSSTNHYRWCFTYIYIYIVSSFKSGAVPGSTWVNKGSHAAESKGHNGQNGHNNKLHGFPSPESALIESWVGRSFVGQNHLREEMGISVPKICCDVQRHLNSETDSEMAEKSYIQHFRKLLTKCFDCTSLTSTVPCKPFAGLNGTGSLDLRPQESPGCLTVVFKTSVAILSEVFAFYPSQLSDDKWRLSPSSAWRQSH